MKDLCGDTIPGRERARRHGAPDDPSGEAQIQAVEKPLKIPRTDSIDELARFWDSHDLTDFEDQLVEVTEPAFERPEDVVSLRFGPQEAAAIQWIADAQGLYERGKS